MRWPAAAQALASAGLLLALVAGAVLYHRGGMTLGAVYALVAYAGMLQAPLMVIASQVRELEESLGAIRRINELFGETSAVQDGPHQLAPPGPGGLDVEFDAVSFSYRPGEPALSGVSFRIPAGRKLALVGRTGSGKSTIARLLLRFADPDGGTVRVGGRDLRELTRDSLRAHVGLVTQEVQLLHAPVRDNVSLFDPDLPDDTISTALVEVGLGGWLDGLPDGLDTVLGAGATGLSAGEAQLLAFARVLVTDPAVVVFDEASSRLDEVSRERFDAAAERLLAGRTALIIAHRPEALRGTDDTLVLGDGKVLEYGPRNLS